MSPRVSSAHTDQPAAIHDRDGGRADPWRVGSIPVVYFVLAVIFFAAGLIELCFAVPQISIFFDRFVPLAVVHTFTLGWISGAIMGVMYRYVPSLTHRPIRWPRMAWCQLALFFLGSTGMVAHFAIGIWFGLWLAAIVMVISIVMFAANLMPCLWPRFGRGVAETGMFLSIAYLIAAALVGTALGIDKSYRFLGGAELTNLSGHVHLAAVGWVTLSICAVSYRMLPAFILPTAPLPRAALWQIYALAGALAGLVASMMLGVPGEFVWGLAVAGAMGWYAAIIARMLRTRRMPLDWTQYHVLAGMLSMFAAIAIGMVLLEAGVRSAGMARLASAYGVIGLLGFFSNVIIGMSYQLFPAFVARVRQSRGWKAVTAAEISVRKPRLFVFAAFNAGVAVMAAGFMAGRTALASGGAIVTAGGGLIYCVTLLWTLGFAFRPSLPRAATRQGLRIMPN